MRPPAADRFQVPACREFRLKPWDVCGGVIIAQVCLVPGLLCLQQEQVHQQLTRWSVLLFRRILLKT